MAGARDWRCVSCLAGLRHAPTLQRASPSRRLVLAVHHFDSLTSGSPVHLPLAYVHGSATKRAERRQSKLPGELAATSPAHDPKGHGPISASNGRIALNSQTPRHLLGTDTAGSWRLRAEVCPGPPQRY